jgi:MinD superfamily P-loop ATPase
MRIAVASGKGGTGKTTIATSLALAVEGRLVLFLDCDVEAPNAHLTLKPNFVLHQPVHRLVPRGTRYGALVVGIALRCVAITPSL